MVGSHVDGFPRTFGPYLLLTSFGRGGMGEVFLAKRRMLADVDRLCVVKTIRGDLAENREYVSRFLDEARVAVQLNHAHICQVYEALRVGADHCLAMEYVPGVNLRDLVHDLREAKQHLDWGIAFYVVEALLDALAFAHALKSPITGEPLHIVHRDVSPANVMVGYDGEVKLIDFGLAESALKQEHTETRLVMGKVAYMAPEQARGDDVDGRADQFSAAVTLTELLLGERFYGDKNAHQIWQVVGSGGYRPERYHTLPEQICEVLDRALAPRMGARFATCEELASALAELRTLHAPRAGKQQLRELMRSLYQARAATLRELVARHAQLRAPDGAAVVEVTLPLRAGPSPIGSGTDQWATSPSAPSPGPIDPRPSMLQPPLSATEPTLPAPVAPSSNDEAGTAAAVRLATPSRPRAAWALAAGALGVATLVIVLAWPSSVAPAAVDDRRDYAGAAADAGSTPSHAPLDAGAAPAVVAAADAGVAGEQDAGTRAAKRAEPPRTGKKPKPPHDVPHVEPTAPHHVAAETPPVVVPNAPPSLDEDFALVMKCPHQCAEELRALLAGKEGDARARVTSEPLLRRCAKRCRGP
ncbi:MAG: protein kinase [Deltaproteobacteria bacterium]|nr:protein kinase [Deltaproteobacteria bacterium]